MVTYETLYLIPLLPLLGAAVLGLIGRRLDKSLVATIALSAVGGAFLICVAATFAVVRHGAPLEHVLWEWIAVGRYSVDLAFGFDQLTATLMLVVTGVGFLIHVYSVGYMHDDPGFWRFFAYLNLFVAMMSILALGRSLPVMFIGWEGVGLASYLLIGFWYTDDEKASAGKKAFITNRVGDFGFLIGIFTLISIFGTVDFAELRQAFDALGGRFDDTLSSGIFAGWTLRGALTLAALSLFLGATGKSAQIPLYVWLPDAMAGPTPVSALIHAATMVTSGVYLLARLGFLFDPAVVPSAMTVVAYVGGATAVFAATIGLAQNDIKKVLAYSTVSQLGYMFLAAGVGAHTAAVFHLVTHAFFKACLFLGSGAVIHALHGEQDMRRMGALRGLLPVVHGTFLASTLAIAGIFPLSGFFSKDAIVGHAFATAQPLGWLAVGGAVMTAFYMGRLMALTFYGDTLRHPDPHAAEHLHAPGWEMKMPLVVLAGLAVLGGALNLPHLMVHHPFLDGWLEPVVKAKTLHLTAANELALMGGSVLLALGGLGLAFVLYRRGPNDKLDALAEGGARPLHLALMNKWWIDELYVLVIVRPARVVGRVAAAIVDPWIIDGVLTKLIPYAVVQGGGRVLRRPQNGNVQAYATAFMVAIAVVSAWALW
jgi:NADH-quinone oxidoreductase subunit L